MILSESARQEITKQPVKEKFFKNLYFDQACSVKKTKWQL